MGISGSRNQVIDGSSNVSPAEIPSSLIVEIKTYVDDQISSVKADIDAQRHREIQNRSWWPGSSELEEEKTKYKELLAKYTELVEKYKETIQIGVQVTEVSSKVSEKAIDDYVKDILDHPDFQHGYFTEAVEGMVYRRALKAVLHAIARAAETANIELMGHRFVFGLEPVAEIEARKARTIASRAVESLIVVPEPEKGEL